MPLVLPCCTAIEKYMFVGPPELLLHGVLQLLSDLHALVLVYRAFLAVEAYDAVYLESVDPADPRLNSDHDHDQPAHRHSDQHRCCLGIGAQRTEWARVEVAGLAGAAQVAGGASGTATPVARAPLRMWTVDTAGWGVRGKSN